MRTQASVLALAGAASSAAAQNVYTVSATPPANAGQPLPDAFVSYSIEFSSFPDFAGNKSSPNTFSDTLLTNIGNLIGTKPHIRVGGNTQDYALYNASLPFAINGTYNLSRSADYPTTIHIGPSYFESYQTWPGVRFSHGFNLALSTMPEGWQTLLDTVPLACKALGPGGLYLWEYGNEPDLYSTSAQGPTRPSSWNESTYVAEWLNGTRTIAQLLRENCPELLGNGSYGYLAPSFAGTGNHLKAPVAWRDGLDADGDIPVFSTHNYISGATSPGVTLQGTLMNHTSTVRSVAAHLSEYNSIFPSGSGSPPIRQIFGECNSLYNEGKPGLSNAFGAALWGVDFNLHSAAVGFGRVHMHQGTDYRYAAWQPLTTNKTTMGTKPPYYASVAVAAFLGDTTRHAVSVAEVPLAGDTESAYAAYADGKLARVAVLNMHGYNTTEGGTGLGAVADPPPRPSRNYTFDLSGAGVTKVLVQRLLANGSDAISGITWDGWSYNYELDGGRPVRLANVTTGEVLDVDAATGQVTVAVPDSSAAVLRLLDCPSSASKRRRGGRALA